ncbi:hypothetical protein [Lactobacillus sp. PSON]|uniref:hypothetical protein n=1 Tax=Lactobacillus sp. PSON TaxID=3455454 RepID=UPI0040414771
MNYINLLVGIFCLIIAIILVIIKDINVWLKNTLLTIFFIFLTLDFIFWIVSYFNDGIWGVPANWLGSLITSFSIFIAYWTFLGNHRPELLLDLDNQFKQVIFRKSDEDYLPLLKYFIINVGNEAAKNIVIEYKVDKNLINKLDLDWEISPDKIVWTGINKSDSIKAFDLSLSTTINGLLKEKQYEIKIPETYIAALINYSRSIGSKYKNDTEYLDKLKDFPLLQITLSYKNLNDRSFTKRFYIEGYATAKDRKNIKESDMVINLRMHESNSKILSLESNRDLTSK